MKKKSKTHLFFTNNKEMNIGSKAVNDYSNYVFCPCSHVQLDQLATKTAKIKDEEKHCFGFQNILHEKPIKTEVNKTIMEIEKMEYKEVLNKTSIEEVNIKQEFEYLEENRSELFVTETEMKIGKIENMTEIPEMAEVSFDDLAVKNEELYIKEEDQDVNDRSSSWTYSGQRQFEDSDSRSSSGEHIPCINRKEVKKHKCDLKTMQKKRLNTHLLRHQNSEDLNGIIKEPAYDIIDTNTYKCRECNYEAVEKFTLKRHILSHKGMAEVEIFKCDECYFETKYKSSIKIHLRRHKEKRLVKLKCSECNWETFYKGHLKNHMLVHQDPADKNKYKCDQCDFRCFKNSKLQRHLLRHKSTDEIEMFKCTECCFQTRFQTSLKAHFHRHKREKLVVHKCTKCDYETNKAFDIRIHLLSHENEQKG